MDAALKRVKNGEPLPGTRALADKIEQVTYQAAWLAEQARLLSILREELPADLSDEAQAALALLVTGGLK